MSISMRHGTSFISLTSSTGPASDDTGPRNLEKGRSEACGFYTDTVHVAAVSFITCRRLSLAHSLFRTNEQVFPGHVYNAMINWTLK